MIHLFRVMQAWHTIGLYYSTISFWELHHHHKASNHPVISKLMDAVFLQHPLSQKWFDPWDVKWLLFLLESWVPASSFTNLKLAWKTAMLLALVTAKHCSDLTLLHVDIQHLFLQQHAAIFVPASGGKMDQLCHLPHELHIGSHSSINLCPMF